MQFIHWVRRNSWILGFILLGLWLAGGVFLPVNGTRLSGLADKDIPARDDLIRLHVIANSDTEEDQALKYMVRDAVVEDLTPKLQQARGITESRLIVQANLDHLKNMVVESIEGQGYHYPVQVQMGFFDFPTRCYGELTLPAGRYEAVRVVIGQGEGANWWCVLFPPLCFINVATGNSEPSEVEYNSYVERVESLNNKAESLSHYPAVPEIAGAPEVGGAMEDKVQVRSKLWDWWRMNQKQTQVSQS
ncbi:MAG: stage II sporulation protein R [Syntrophomonadaceae bacterium]|nr:stage II sporulation protein R [Syntrophomonadaceae bacterium]